MGTRAGLAPDPKYFGSRLWDVAIRVASQIGFTQECEYRLKGFIRGGVERMIREYRSDEIGTAEGNLARFVERMIAEARRMGLNPLEDISIKNKRRE
jgi:hypothetical protein